MGDDVLATIRVFKNFGIDIERASENTLTITGCNMSLTQGDYHLNLGNSGTSIRLLMGLLAGIENNEPVSLETSRCKATYEKGVRTPGKNGS